MRYLLLIGLVFALNLLPAFGPPTWTILVYARLRWHYDPVLLVVLGAGAAASGRLVLGLAFRALRLRFPDRYRTNLERLKERLAKKQGQAIALAGLFFLSPLPSAQLFCAAGLLNLRITVLALAFFAGRLVTYSIYVATAVIVDTQLSSVLARMWGSPWWIAVDILFLAALALLPLRDWGHTSAPPTN